MHSNDNGICNISLFPSAHWQFSIAVLTYHTVVIISNCWWQEPSGTDGGRKKGTCSQDEEDGDGDGAGVWDEGQRKSSKTEGLWSRGNQFN